MLAGLGRGAGRAWQGCWPTLGFGLLALGSFAVVLAEADALGAVTATVGLVLVTVATPLVLGPLGGLWRGLVPNAPVEVEPDESASCEGDADAPAGTHSD